MMDKMKIKKPSTKFGTKCFKQKCLSLKKEKLIPYHISLFKTILMFCILIACNSAKRVTHKRNNFLLNNRIDTLKICASEVSIRDSSIIPCLDALISDTKKLHEYDERIEPLFWIRFVKRVRGSVLVDFESDNHYVSLDAGFLLGIKTQVYFPKVTTKY